MSPPEPVPFEYAVLRLVPRVDRGEFVNVGAVLYCQNRDFLRCASDLDETRVQTLFPGADLTAVSQALQAICAVCDGDPSAGLAGAQSLRARFGWLTAARSTVIQPGPVHSGLTADPAAELHRIMRNLVQPSAFG